MATFITHGSQHESLMGSPEKRVDTAPDGRLWTLMSEGGKAKLFSSTDAGASWEYASGSDLDLNISSNQSNTFPSFFIDRDGYAHVSWTLHNRSPQAICYARGVPRSGGGWAWNRVHGTPQIGGMTVDSDVVAFPHGSGWVAWVAYGAGGHGKVARFDISSNGTISIPAINHGPPNESSSAIVAIEFDHIGDGKTPSATPHIYLVGGAQGYNHELAGWKATYSGGQWTWPAYRGHTTLEGDGGGTNGTTNIANTVMSMVWDGSRVCTVWEHGTSLRFVEWAPGSAPVRRDLPALPSDMTGGMRGCSIAHDPPTDDLYVVAYTRYGSKVVMSKLTRATNTWSGWTTVATRVDSDHDGKVQLVRHPSRDAVDMVYATLGWQGSWPFSLYHQQVAKLARTPEAPRLLQPANGQRLDLEAGATFGWEHQQTGPSDTQQAWGFRRTVDGVVQHWNHGAQAFQATAHWNAGQAIGLSFTQGMWANGKSYPWTVRTRSSSGQDSDWAPERTVIATTAPVVLVTSPLGLVFAESTPLVEFTYTSADPMRDYEVVVTRDATLDPANPEPQGVEVWRSGIITSSTGRSARVGVSLEDGATYRAWVRATSTTGLSSAWDWELFSLSLEPPSGPLVQLSPEWSYPDEVPRARLRVQARSNLMGTDQAVGESGWEADGSNTTLAFFAGDLSLTLERGLRLTAVGAGRVAARNVLGTPPPAPIGQPQPLGPLSFPVIGGQAYTALAYFHADMQPTTAAGGNVTYSGPPRAARLTIRWYAEDEGEELNDPGSAMATTLGDQIVTADTEYRRAVIHATAPDGARRATVVPEVLGLDAGEAQYVSRLSFHPGTDEAWQPGGFSGTQTVRVERSDDEGRTWVQVIDRLGVNVYQQAVARDRLMPLGRDVLYRAFTDVQAPSGTVLSSASSPIGTLRVDSAQWVLRDIGDAAEGGEVNALVIAHDRADQDAAVVHRPIGREEAIVDSEGAQSAAGSLTIYVPVQVREKTVDLLRRGATMLVQTPLGMRYRVRFLARDYVPEVAGSRTITAEYVEV